jgi:predicted O-methyltransferase YrrM
VDGVPRLVKDPHAYFRALVPERAQGELLLAAAATDRGVPVIGPVMGSLLALLCRIMGALRVLELGSAVGYSTFFLARAMRDTGGFALSVDMHEAHCREARANLASFGLGERCALLCADARALPFGRAGFDLVFLDVDQRYYAELEPVCHRLLRPGGLLVADNTAFADADVFNNLVQDGGRWDAVNIYAFLPNHAPEQDGICLARKKQTGEAKNDSHGNFQRDNED